MAHTTRIKAGGILFALVLLTSLYLVTNSGNSAFASSKEKQGIMVPLYTYPDKTWDTVADVKKAHPKVPVVAIVNPASGPGSQKDSNYASGISDLQDAGVKVIGYVSTAYTGRSLDAVKADIDTWKKFYPEIDGIFFDEQTNWAGGEWYYKQADSHAKSNGLSFTVGNPGADSIPSYLDTVDVVLIYESPGLPDLNNYENTWGQYKNSKLGMIPFAVSSLPHDWVQRSANTIGWIYVTDDVLSNPWDSLPHYFEQLVQKVDGNSPAASSSDAEEEEQPEKEAADLKVKATKKIKSQTVSFYVKNPRSGDAVYKFVIDTPSGIDLKPTKSPKGWDVEDDSSTVTFDADNRPVKAGKLQKFNIKLDSDSSSLKKDLPEFEWSAYGKNGQLLDSGSIKPKTIR